MPESRTEPATRAGAPGSRKRRRRGERGQNLVEFALILPIFMFIVLGTIEFGWVLKSYITVTNSAREGARYGIVCPVNDNQIRERVNTHSNGMIQTSEVTVAWRDSVSNNTVPRCTSEGYVEVQAGYDYGYITPLPGLVRGLTGRILPSSLRLESTTKMRVE
jgi:Flp pilus assembly protein TadG